MLSISSSSNATFALPLASVASLFSGVSRIAAAVAVAMASSSTSTLRLASCVSRLLVASPMADRTPAASRVDSPLWMLATVRVLNPAGNVTPLMEPTLPERLPVRSTVQALISLRPPADSAKPDLSVRLREVYSHTCCAVRVDRPARSFETTQSPRAGTVPSVA